MNPTTPQSHRRPRGLAIRYSRMCLKRNPWLIPLALLILAILCLTAAGCASRNRAADAALSAQSSSVAPLPSEGSFDSDEDADAQSGHPRVVVYFDLDSSEIRPEFRAPLMRVANQLGNGASLALRLEGDADERGTREYNVGLGERRAQAVRRFLLLNGVRDARLSTVSYGEERPVDTGHAEAAWSKNRRVELVATSRAS